MRVVFCPKCGYMEPVRTRNATRNSSEYTVEGLWRYIVECSSFASVKVASNLFELIRTYCDYLCLFGAYFLMVNAR